MHRNALLFCFLSFCQLAYAQRGVDFRQWSSPVQFTSAEIEANMRLMLKHNINEVWVDRLLDRPRWEEQGKRLGVKVHSSNQRFGVAWLQQCRPLPNEGRIDSTDCITGLVNIDGVVGPDLLQLKQEWAPITFSFSKNRLKIQAISNRYQLPELSYNWVLKADGTTVESGKFSVENDDKRAANINLKMKTVTHNKQNYLLEIFARNKQENTSSGGRHIVAKAQFQLSHIKQKPIKIDVHSKLVTIKGKHEIELHGKDFSYTISRKSGLLTSMVYKGAELLSEPLTPIFRFPEEAMQQQAYPLYWEKNITVSSMATNQVNEYLTTINVDLRLGELQDHLKLNYKIYATGDIQYSQEITTADTRLNLKRFGATVQFISKIDSVDWFGRGPFSNYVNANSAAFIGNYKMPLQEFEHPYFKTKNEVRSNTEWVALSLENASIFLGADSLFTAMYSLQEKGRLSLFVNELSGKKSLSQKVRQGQSYRFTVRLRPFDSAKENGFKLSRYTANKMAVPRAKVMESKSNEEVK